MRCGVTLLVVVALAAAGAAVARAADATGTTTGTTTTSTTTTATTTTTAGTTTAPATTYARLTKLSLPKSCVGAGAVAISEHGQPTVVLGGSGRQLAASDYPASAPFLQFDSATRTGSRCGNDAITLENVSLFGGTVTATSIRATDGIGSADGLEIDGGAVTATPGESVALGNWGLLQLQVTSGRISAPVAVHLLRKHASLPAGTTIFLGFAAVRAAPAKPKAPPATTTAAAVTTRAVVRRTAKRKKHHHKPKVAQPLKQTPRLGFAPSHYDFPIDGGASYIDTYGANRNDIYDGWHHGDDLFAPLGTPVVAVANGTLSLVGWNALGGWRVWLTDAKGNSFYYAHLSGYSRKILRDRHVRAGQVIGFLGRTGDAFTTTPHVHFEIHPHQLLKLGYDGAVDPTTYLQSWRVVKVPADRIPDPARLRAPAGTPAQESSVVWHQLLKARHLQPDGEPLVGHTTPLRRPFPGTYADGARPREVLRRLSAVHVAAHVPAPTGDVPWQVVLALSVAASVVGTFVGVRRRRGAAAS